MPKSSSACASMSTSSSRVTDRSLAGFSDVHVRRPIVERADEVFGVAGAGQPVAIGERDAIRVVVDDLQRRRSDSFGVAAASAIGLPLPSAICPVAAGRSVSTCTRTSVPAGA